MNHRLLACFALLLSLGLVAVIASPQEKTATWEAVNEAVGKGLPKTAIDHLQVIQTRAINDGKHAEAIKAIAMKVALEGNIQGGKPEEKITRMRSEIANAPQEMQPMMEAIVANWFWHYLQQNRWRFMQRTQTANSPSDDFTTWDLPRLLAEIDKQFDQVLDSSESLKDISVDQYDTLFEKGNAPDSYRPTVFDFVAHNALEFYASGEQVASRTQDAFDLSADGPIFDSTEAFLARDPESKDQTSLVLRAVKLYQQ
ncbi:hypothetical protein N9D38_12195, partial [Rubripirellula sp.]|nr:hypothetical protein [Rubripirellula sp.]